MPWPRERCITLCLESPALITHTVARRMKWHFSGTWRTCLMVGQVPGRACGHPMDFPAIASGRQARWLHEESCWGLNGGQAPSVLVVRLGDAVLKWGAEVDDRVCRARGREPVRGRGRMNRTLLESNRESTTILPSLAWKLMRNVLE